MGIVLFEIARLPTDPLLNLLFITVKTAKFFLREKFSTVKVICSYF